MDPNLLPILLAQSNQHFQNIEFAKLQAQEKHQQEIFAEERQKLLDFAKTESEILLHDSLSQPQKVFIKSQVLLNRLKHLNVVPDMFEDQTEKENVILLWNKLVGISKKCHSQLLPEQFDQCTKCLEAIWMQGFIQDIAQRLNSYNQYQSMKEKLGKEKKLIKRFEIIFYFNSWCIDRIMACMASVEE
ncbi:MAG: hypothetical protein QM730_30375 [Anaerolineales bacterium]